MGGVDSTPASPRRPYGSLAGHSTRGRRDKTKDMASDLYGGSSSPSSANFNRTLSGTTDTTDVDTVTHEPPPVASSVASSRKTRSRGMGSSGPSLDEVPPADPPRGPSPPALHSRAPSMVSLQRRGVVRRVSSESRGALHSVSLSVRFS